MEVVSAGCLAVALEMMGGLGGLSGSGFAQGEVQGLSTGFQMVICELIGLDVGSSWMR